MTVRRIVLWWFVAAMIAAQTLGLMHRVAHPSAAAAASVHSQSAQGDGWVAKLFAHDDTACKLFDQSAQGDTVACAPSLPLSLALPAHIITFFQGEAVARWAAFFDARGPPSVR